MFIAMNRFKINPGAEEGFEKVWRERDTYLSEVEGFQSFALLRGPRVEVPDGDEVIPFGVARQAAEGLDVTLVAMGASLKPAEQALRRLSKEGISADLLDLRTLVPLDKQAILDSVARTGRLVVADEARDTCSAASQIAAIVADEAFDHLKAPIRRVTVPDVAMPYAPSAEKPFLPTPDRIADAVRTILPATEDMT